MKFLTRFFLAVFLCINLQYPTSAQEFFCGNQQQKKILVAFGNGVLSDLDKADESLAAITDRLYVLLPRDEFADIKPSIAYNTSVDGLTDIYESVQQKIANDSYVTQFWRWMSNLDPLPDWLQEAMKQKLAAIDPTTYLEGHDLSIHLDMYRTAILEGKKVIVVAHSQGNFFANKAYDVLYSGVNPIGSTSFGIVSVANPASFVGGEGPYTTLEEDMVINTIRAVSVLGAAQPLPWNVTNGIIIDNPDPFRHLFLETYLYSGSNSEKKIMDDILGMIQILVSPPQVAQPGAITATLTWGTQPDIDLHAFELLGTASAHVYYDNMVGIAGRLDVDDRSQYGPEHYTVNCETLQAGTYHIGVNYYYGFAPETVHVQIAAGTSIRSFERTLPAMLGSSGNADPVSVADIVVTGDQQHGFSLDILESVPPQPTAPTVGFGEF